MKFAVIAALALAALCAVPGFAQQKDDPKCKDHPLFNRMPDSWIHSCDHRTFNAFDFTVAQGKKTSIEGEYWKLNYYPQASAATKPSDVQIIRNFQNAAKQLGAKELYSTKSLATFLLKKDGKETWIQVWAEFTGKYGFVIIAREAMQQDIVANAAALADGLKTSGHIALQGIFFDTGKSELKPESDQALGEIAKLLLADPSLKVFVVGHTDNVGGLESNMKLSQDRAAAVMQALASKHGIAAGRMKAFGAGPYAPVASNDAEDGRAQNRRVELVKQ